jgi:hypothetical protein
MNGSTRAEQTIWRTKTKRELAGKFFWRYILKKFRRRAAYRNSEAVDGSDNNFRSACSSVITDNYRRFMS